MKGGKIDISAPTIPGPGIIEPFLTAENIELLLSLFIDEWNIFSIPMISIFIEHNLKFGTAYLGIITGATVSIRKTVR